MHQSWQPVYSHCASSGLQWIQRFHTQITRKKQKRKQGNASTPLKNIFLACFGPTNRTQKEKQQAVRIFPELCALPGRIFSLKQTSDKRQKRKFRNKEGIRKTPKTCMHFCWILWFPHFLRLSLMEKRRFFIFSSTQMRESQKNYSSVVFCCGLVCDLHFETTIILLYPVSSVSDWPVCERRSHKEGPCAALSVCAWSRTTQVWSKAKPFCEVAGLRSCQANWLNKNPQGNSNQSYFQIFSLLSILDDRCVIRFRSVLGAGPTYTWQCRVTNHPFLCFVHFLCYVVLLERMCTLAPPLIAPPICVPPLRRDQHLSYRFVTKNITNVSGETVMVIDWARNSSVVDTAKGKRSRSPFAPVGSGK